MLHLYISLSLPLLRILLFQFFLSDRVCHVRPWDYLPCQSVLCTCVPRRRVQCHCVPCVCVTCNCVQCHFWPCNSRLCNCVPSPRTQWDCTPCVYLPCTQVQCHCVSCICVPCICMPDKCMLMYECVCLYVCGYVLVSTCLYLCACTYVLVGSSAYVIVPAYFDCVFVPMWLCLCPCASMRVTVCFCLCTCDCVILLVLLFVCLHRCCSNDNRCPSIPRTPYFSEWGLFPLYFWLSPSRVAICLTSDWRIRRWWIPSILCGMFIFKKD